ncbi:hypothetical protein ACFL13_00060 [Patescibacteria group bacterium]
MNKEAVMSDANNEAGKYTVLLVRQSFRTLREDEPMPTIGDLDICEEGCELCGVGYFRVVGVTTNKEGVGAWSAGGELPELIDQREVGDKPPKLTGWDEVG